MSDGAAAPVDGEIVELSGSDWNEAAFSEGWSDGLPTVCPTESAVEPFLAQFPSDFVEFEAISPRQVIPGRRALAANAVMAGCVPEAFPLVLAALRGVLKPEFNLHGVLATTHPCGQMVIVSGPARHALGINCGSNCLGQGWRANLTIGRALALILRNIGGATPGEMDRSTQGSPAKISFCFGENQEESPFEPFHVRQGFRADQTVVSVMACEGPHNINDHGSRTGEGVMTMITESISQPGANTIYGKGPLALILGPEHAATLHRDGWTVPQIQHRIFERARVHISRIGEDNRVYYDVDSKHPPDGEHYTLAPSPADIHVLVAGGAGKHSSWMPSFGATKLVSTAVQPPG